MKLSLWMARKGVDDDALAEAVGSHRTTISRIRRRKKYPSWTLAADIKKFTKGLVRLDDFHPLDNGSAPP